MNITTTYSPGDIVYAIACKKADGSIWEVTGPFTIGRVSATVTDSPGRPDEETFDNYKPQKSYREDYMMVETGIGSGQIYTVEYLFPSFEEAARAARLAEHLVTKSA